MGKKQELEELKRKAKEILARPEHKQKKGGKRPQPVDTVPV